MDGNFISERPVVIGEGPLRDVAGEPPHLGEQVQRGGEVNGGVAEDLPRPLKLDQLRARADVPRRPPALCAHRPLPGAAVPAPGHELRELRERVLAAEDASLCLHLLRVEVDRARDGEEDVLSVLLLHPRVGEVRHHLPGHRLEVVHPVPPRARRAALLQHAPRAGVGAPHLRRADVRVAVDALRRPAAVPRPLGDRGRAHRRKLVALHPRQKAASFSASCASRAAAPANGCRQKRHAGLHTWCSYVRERLQPPEARRDGEELVALQAELPRLVELAGVAKACAGAAPNCALTRWRSLGAPTPAAAGGAAAPMRSARAAPRVLVLLAEDLDAVEEDVHPLRDRDEVEELPPAGGERAQGARARGDEPPRRLLVVEDEAVAPRHGILQLRRRHRAEREARRGRSAARCSRAGRDGFSRVPAPALLQSSATSLELGCHESI
eukprot:gene11012-biopygen8950